MQVGQHHEHWGSCVGAVRRHGHCMVLLTTVSVRGSLHIQSCLVPFIAESSGYGHIIRPGVKSQEGSTFTWVVPERRHPRRLRQPALRGAADMAQNLYSYGPTGVLQTCDVL